MSQVQISTLLGPIAQICRGCNTTTMVDAYIRAVRRLCRKSRWYRSTLLGATVAPVTADYTTGTVTVTSGSPVVVGAGTAWLTEARSGDTFTGPDGEAMPVQAVLSDTNLTLFENYAGATLGGQAYTLTRDRGTWYYNLGSDAYNEIVGISAVSIRGADGKMSPLTQRASTTWDADDVRTIPRLYEYVPHAQLALHPTPDAIYQMAVGLVLQPKINSNSIDDVLLVDWSETFIHGALGYLYDIHDMAWTDRVESERMTDRFEAGINGATSAVAAGYNAGGLPAQGYGARTGMTRTGRQAI